MNWEYLTVLDLSTATTIKIANEIKHTQNHVNKVVALAVRGRGENRISEGGILAVAEGINSTILEGDRGREAGDRIDGIGRDGRFTSTTSTSSLTATNLDVLGGTVEVTKHSGIITIRTSIRATFNRTVALSLIETRGHGLASDSSRTVSTIANELLGSWAVPSLAGGTFTETSGGRISTAISEIYAKTAAINRRARCRRRRGGNTLAKRIALNNERELIEVTLNFTGTFVSVPLVGQLIVGCSL